MPRHFLRLPRLRLRLLRITSASTAAFPLPSREPPPLPSRPTGSGSPKIWLGAANGLQEKDPVSKQTVYSAGKGSVTTVMDGVRRGDSILDWDDAITTRRMNPTGQCGLVKNLVAFSEVGNGPIRDAILDDPDRVAFRIHNCQSGMHNSGTKNMSRTKLKHNPWPLPCDRCSLVKQATLHRHSRLDPHTLEESEHKALLRDRGVDLQ